MTEHGPTSHALHEVPSTGGHDAHDDHGGIAKYIYVFIALCILTSMSFWTYADFPVKWPFHDTPQVGWAFMMAVSCAKAMLVILFFMHVKYEANWKYILTIPAAMMSIFLILMLVPDVGNRGRYASEERKYYMAEPKAKTAHPAAEPSHSGH
jgi:cytochrome c oxidase subunit 4